MNKRNWRPFEEAREFARSLGFSTYLEWEEYAKSGNKPADIPAQPRVVYKNDGWRGAADWVGREWRTFEEAREFVRSLGLKTGDEWREYYKSGQKPDDIPAEPRSAYKGQFLGWGDWLGSGYVSTSRRKFRPFEEAREFARSLGLGSAKEWHSYSKSGNRPADIPSNPDRIYKEHWLGYGDWLGTGSVASYNKVFRPFEEAHEFARTLGLKKFAQWDAYTKSGQKPDDIPVNPAGVYGKKWETETAMIESTDSTAGEQGEWRGWADWLGVVSRWTARTSWHSLRTSGHT